MILSILNWAYATTTLFSIGATELKYASAKSRLLRNGCEKVDFGESNRGFSEVLSDFLHDNWFLLIPVLNVVKTVKLLKKDRFSYADNERKPILINRGVIVDREAEEKAKKEAEKAKKEAEEAAKAKEKEKEKEKEKKPEKKPEETKTDAIDIEVEMATLREKDRYLRERYKNAKSDVEKKVVYKELWKTHNEYMRLKGMVEDKPKTIKNNIPTYEAQETVEEFGLTPFVRTLRNNSNK